MFSVTDLTALALNAAHQLSAAELHGAVCGVAVCDGDEFAMQDLIDLVGVDALSDEEAVARFVDASLADLYADDLRFTPLLPEDDAPLEERVLALGQWCASFLAGLGARLASSGATSGPEGLAALPDELREIVDDFVAISEIDPDSTQAGDAAEAELLQLQEFVKVGALLTLSLLNDEPDHPAG